MLDSAGKTLAQRYRILDKLGEGAMSQVYLAYDADRGCPVAVKVLMPSSSNEEEKESIQRFRREAESFIRLKHPNIVPLYETEESDEAHFLIMEYIEGQSLAEILKARPGKRLPLPEALRILYQIGRALHFAHKNQVYHRDVKPSNILIDHNDRAYLTDFGVALLADLTRLTKETKLIGTPSYAAPEQWKERTVDARTDVYAVGELLYEMLTGRPPFIAGDLASLIGQILYDSPIPPRQLNARIPPAVERTILKALSKEMDDRYPDVEIMLNTLRATVEGQEKSAEYGAFLHQRLPPPPIFRRPLFWAVCMPVMIVAILGGLIASGLVPAGQIPGMWGSGSSPTPSLLPTSTAMLTPTFTPVPTPLPSSTTTPTATPAPTSTGTPSATPTTVPTATPTLLPTPFLLVNAEQLTVYAGPGEQYDEWGQVRRGDRLALLARSKDGTWWQVDHFGKIGWVRAQPIGSSIDPFTLPTIEAPPTPTKAPEPAEGMTLSVPQSNVEIALRNPGFEDIKENFIPGWRRSAYDNYSPGDRFDPDTSFDEPFFKQADDPARIISGPTLQIDTAGYPKFRAHVFQTINVPPDAMVRFQVSARAYSSVGNITVKAGVDPDGGYDCKQAIWGRSLMTNEVEGVVRLIAPDVAVGQAGRVTVCIFAESLYASPHQAAFFDDAELIMNPE